MSPHQLRDTCVLNCIPESLIDKDEVDLISVNVSRTSPPIGPTVCALGVESRYLQSSCCSLRKIANVYFLFHSYFQDQGPRLYKFFEHVSVLNSQSVLGNDVTSYCLAR